MVIYQHKQALRHIIKSIESTLDALDYLDEESPTDEIQIILEKYKAKHNFVNQKNGSFKEAK